MYFHAAKNLMYVASPQTEKWLNLETWTWKVDPELKKYYG